MRLVVSVYLMIATLVAPPVVCPCTLAQLLSGLQTTRPVEPGELTPPCPCCPRPPASSDTFAEQSDQASKHLPAQSPCPCKSRQATAIPVTRELASPGADDTHSHFFLDYSLDGCAIVTAMIAAENEAIDEPFFNPKDLLPVYHRLRC